MIAIFTFLVQTKHEIFTSDRFIRTFACVFEHSVVNQIFLFVALNYLSNRGLMDIHR